MSPADPDVLLVDEPDRAGRTTASLVASLAGRLAVLPGVSGADVVGALAAGVAAVGREAAETAEGRRLRDALARGRPSTNATLLWQRLGIDRWLATMPASPVLDQLRNDAALLLVDDLGETLDLPPLLPDRTGGDAVGPGTVDPLDLVLGLWALARETEALVEALADASGEPAPRVVPGAGRAVPVDGVVLR